MHPLDPAVLGNIYWVVNRTRKLPAAAEGFNAFLKEYIANLPVKGSAKAA